MKKNKLIIFWLIVILFVPLIILNVTLAQTNTSANNSSGSYVNSNDAIGVRIIPNNDHLSISSWYKSKGFTGAPQALIVDGYEAIRDGRTVYVNAANVKGKQIFTNIYLISYNQDPSIKTIDILGQIVKNWKFNTDLVERTNPAPSCEISSVSCTTNADCVSNQICSTSANDSPYSFSTPNSCQLKTTKYCLTDSDCPTSFFCSSAKAKIIRDMKRISKTEDLKEALYKYKSAKGYYPKLSAGSYLSNQTISAWPSWSESFLSELSLPSITDPVNRLGACPGYDAKTCWNKDTRRFYSASNGSLLLPAGSFGFVYKTDSQGSTFDLCSVMETREPTTDLNFQFSPAMPVNSNCVLATGVLSNGTLSNTAPHITNSYLMGDTGQEFKGSLEVVDNQNNPMTWDFNTSGVNWIQAGWSAAPTLKETANPNQKKITAVKAGNPGVYPVKLTVTDGVKINGLVGTLSTTTNIVIVNPKSFIEAENAEYLLNPKTTFNYSFYFSDDNLVDYKTAFKVTAISSSNAYNPLSAPSSVEAAGINRYKVNYLVKIPVTSKFYFDANYIYRLTVSDKFRAETTKDIKIAIKSAAPNLNFNCSSTGRLGSTYSCLLGPTEQADQKLTYSTNGLNFGGLVITSNATSSYLSSQETNLPTSGSSSTTVSIKVTNEYGASTTKAFNLSLKTYCGDGILQDKEPNTEARGGIYNDGYEDCDGTAGVATSVSTSSSKQYACTTFNKNTPNPIVTNGYCVFKSPVNGGGFCGDGYCQTKYENKDNCDQDCLSICVPTCEAKGSDCGDNGCGGICGECSIGDECFGGKCCMKEATIKTSFYSGNQADEIIEVYFNGKKGALSSSGSFDGVVSHGKNVLAIKADGFESFDRAIVAKLDQISQTINPVTKQAKNACRAVTTDNLKNWKCRNTINNGSYITQTWADLDYNDSSWTNPINTGTTTQGANIWALDFLDDEQSKTSQQLTTAYCRYTFTGDQLDSDHSTPDCAGKECGPNGVGGSCRPNNCPAINIDSANNKPNQNFKCNETLGKCECTKDTAETRNANNNKIAGQEGSACGTFSDTCNGMTKAGNICGEGLYCNLSTANNKAKNYYIGEHSYVALGIQIYDNTSITENGGDLSHKNDYQFITKGCNSNAPDNTCQKKCWDTSITKELTVRQGDIPETTTCALASKKEDPDCDASGYANPACPSDCDATRTELTGGKGIKNDSCVRGYSCWFGMATCYEWNRRLAWSCSETVTTRAFFGQSCGAGNNAIDASGNCTCKPIDCAGKCGSNGCGGVCNNGLCGDSQICSSGTCVSCSHDCSGKACGQENSCGEKCSSGSCPTLSNGVALTCENNTCTCKPNCAGKTCGADDSCGGKCYNVNNTCGASQYCTTFGCRDSFGACESQTDNLDYQEVCWSKDSEGTCPANNPYKCLWFTGGTCSSLKTTGPALQACASILTRSACKAATPTNLCRWMSDGFCTSLEMSKKLSCKINRTFGDCEAAADCSWNTLE
ncbi:MAG: hypothetical protein ACOYL8_02015 [Patescibacteria group bacterium]